MEKKNNTMKMRKKNVQIILIFLLLWLSVLADASAVEEISKRINEVVCILLCIIWYVGGGLAALVLILAGIKYLTSESGQERDEAKSRIVQAIVGLIIILVAVPLVNFLIQNTLITEFSCTCGQIP